jgi:hypothetical protein
MGRTVARATSTVTGLASGFFSSALVVEAVSLLLAQPESAMAVAQRSTEARLGADPIRVRASRGDPAARRAPVTVSKAGEIVILFLRASYEPAAMAVPAPPVVYWRAARHGGEGPPARMTFP